jgi:hypothetical protein
MTLGHAEGHAIALQAGLKGLRAEDVPGTVRRIAECLHAAPVASGLFVVSMQMDYARELRLALWQWGGEWQSASLSPNPGNILHFDLVKETPGGYEALTVMRYGGSAHAGALFLLRFASGMTVLSKSNVFDKFDELILDDHWVLGTYRDPAVYKEPHVVQANCCYPINGQVLWKWEGDALVTQGYRLFSAVGDFHDTLAGVLALQHANERLHPGGRVPGAGPRNWTSSCS